MNELPAEGAPAPSSASSPAPSHLPSSAPDRKLTEEIVGAPPRYTPSGLGGGLILVAVHLVFVAISFGDHTSDFLRIAHRQSNVREHFRGLGPLAEKTLPPPNLPQQLFEAAWWLAQAQNYLFPVLAGLLFILFFAKHRLLPPGYRLLLWAKGLASLGIALAWTYTGMRALFPRVYYEGWTDFAWDLLLLIILGLYIGGERATNTFKKKPRPPEGGAAT
jgi:hypothetical protein